MVGGWKLVIKVNTSHGESWWTRGFFFWAATRARTSGRYAVSDKPLLLQQWTTILAVRHCWLVAVHLQTASAGKVVNNVSQFTRTRDEKHCVVSTVWHTFPGIKRSFQKFLFFSLLLLRAITFSYFFLFIVSSVFSFLRREREGKEERGKVKFEINFRFEQVFEFFFFINEDG